MIEKLSETQTESQRYKIVRKVNELVDVVNHIKEEYDIQIAEIERRISAFDDPTYHEAEPETRPENVQSDPETRSENVQVDEIEQAEKWIGKLCWFSQIYECHQHIAILKRISESGLYVTDDGELYYAYCEPVKPDDDIIYKEG